MVLHCFFCFVVLALLGVSVQGCMQRAEICSMDTPAGVEYEVGSQLSLSCNDSGYYVSYDIETRFEVRNVNIYVLCDNYCAEYPEGKRTNGFISTPANITTECEVIGCFVYEHPSGTLYFGFNNPTSECMLATETYTTTPETSTEDTTTPMENETLTVDPMDTTTIVKDETATVDTTTPTDHGFPAGNGATTVLNDETPPVEPTPSPSVAVVVVVSIVLLLLFGIVTVGISIVLWKAKKTRFHYPRNSKYFEPLEPFDNDDSYLPPISIECLKSVSESQLSIYHPLYHLATDPEIQKAYISQSNTSPLQSLTKEDLKAYYTMSGSGDGQNNYQHLDSLPTPRYSQSSLYEDLELSPSNSERADQNYVKTAFNYPTDTDTGYVEGSKESSDMAVHQEPNYFHPEPNYFHPDADNYDEHFSENETIDLIQVLPLEENDSTEFNAHFEDGSIEAYQEAAPEYDGSQDTDGVVFEFGDNSSSSLKEPSFEIDPKSLTSFSDYLLRGLDYMLTHEDRSYDYGVSNCVPVADDYVDTGHEFLGIHADTSDYTDDVECDYGHTGYRRSTVFFPRLKYDYHGRANIPSATTSSSYISSSTSMNSGYISSETSLYGDSGIGARIHFIPTSPFDMDFSFSEEIPIYNLTN